MDREALGKWSCISRVEDRVDREAIYDHHDLVERRSGGDRAEGSPIGRDDRAEIGKMSCGEEVVYSPPSLRVSLSDHKTLSYFIAESIASDQTRQMHRLGKSYASRNAIRPIFA
ncbi:hypothetical protein DPMN_015612 [Dreissena polymorpha]|uniref:Uncharacterized protein n=1 Tax=Dreissena polymorpha TaxID=45954 RepID=A0A9D4S5Q7_DREPO|nr:hypothetical protein DPMN_015612 [Dreissena polymorpha]